MDSKTFAIVLNAISDSFPLPEFSDREAVKTWAGELAGDTVDLVNNLGGRDAALEKLAGLTTLNSVLEPHVETYCADKTEAFGDRFKNIDWAKLIQLIMTIIALFPKTTPPATA